MRLFRRTVTPTLLLSEAGVLVEAAESHLFPPGGQKPGQHLREIPTPRGAAAVAIQFVHEVGVRFVDLQVFRLTYYHRAPGQDLFEEYLAVPYDRLQFGATPMEVSSLSADQRNVLAALLSKSDLKAWEASEPVRTALRM